MARAKRRHAAGARRLSARGARAGTPALLASPSLVTALGAGLPPVALR
jgi:hypothetical protein